MGCSHRKMKTVPSEPTLEVTPWKLLYTTALDQWASVEAARWGFDVNIDWCQRKTQLQPWCTSGRFFEAILPAPFDPQELDVKYNYSQVLIQHSNGSNRVNFPVSYRHRISNKIKVAPLLDSAQIISSRDHIVLLQIATTLGFCEVHVIDLNRNKILGTYAEKYHDKPYLYECIISPDYTHIILKPNLLFVLKYRIHSVDDSVRVIAQSPDSSRYNVISELFRESALDLILTFDPRRRHIHVAVANLPKRGQHVLCIYNIKNRKIMQKTYGPLYQRTQNLVFSPDGDHLAALIVTYIFGASMHPQRFNFQGVMVYSTRKLSLLHKIPSFGTSALSSVTPAALFPAFSSSGDYIALGSGNGVSVGRVEVYKMPAAMTLQSLCRAKLRSFLTTDMILALPVPQLYKDYILYKPMYD